MRVELTVNGAPVSAEDVWPGENLLYVLRERLGFRGSKNACEQGECGSCSVYLDGVLVLREEFDGAGKRRKFFSMRKFTPEDVGMWEVRVVTASGEVLRTGRLHYQEVTQYNTSNRKNFIAPCSLGASAINALVEAQAPVSEITYLIEQGAPLRADGSPAKDLVARAVDDGNMPFLEGILAASGHEVDIPPDVKDYVKALEEEIRIRIFTTPD